MLGTAFTLLVPGSAAASAQQDGAAAPGAVHVIEVSGRVDPVLVDFITRSLRRAEEAKVEVLVMRVDSRGALVDTAALDVLAFQIAHSPVPVAVWVGPTGARAYGGAYRLVAASEFAGMAPGARVGRTGTDTGLGGVRAAAALGAEAARARGLVDTIEPTLGAFIVNLDGQRIGEKTLRTRRVVTEDGIPRLQAAGEVRFAKLGLVERVLHSTARPAVAYLLLVVGALLMVFEFFSAGIGVAGVTGACSLVLACHGLAVLPTSPLGLALMAIGLFGLAVDVQTGAPRSWTVIGVVALVLGSWVLFPADLALSWLTIAVIVAGTALLMISGMAAMLRSRFSTPTIGRESMVGEMGEATTGIDPEGTVRLRGGVWRARTNRATPIPAGVPVRVVAIDGLLLEVEPEEGGARDAGH